MLYCSIIGLQKLLFTQIKSANQPNVINMTLDEEEINTLRATILKVANKTRDVSAGRCPICRYTKE